MSLGLRESAYGARGMDLLIIGGGASGTAMLQALAAAVSRGERGLPRRIALVERTRALGPGLPYGETSEPFHTMGRTRTRRHEKGAQLRDRFERSAALLRTSGLTLHLRAEDEARALERDADGGWRLHTQKAELSAPCVVLATGHWHVHRLSHLRRAVDWRWDVRRLHAAVADEDDVLVLGMGQSGLDVAVALAERRARLPRERVGIVRLVSRTGLLPSVFGHIGDRRLSGATRSLEALVARGGLVRLHEVIEAVAADAQTVARAHGLEAPAAGVWTDEALTHWLSSRPDGVTLLREELSIARASLQAQRPIPWHPVLWHGMEQFHALMPRLPAEDRLLLAERWTPLLRHAEAIHAEAAERLLRGIDAGLIEVHAAGPDLRLEEDVTSIRAHGTFGTLQAKHVVDARGPDPRVELSDDALLKSLLAEGHVTPARIPFCERPSPRQRAIVPLGWHIEDEPGPLVTGGVWVDPETFGARDVEGDATRGLYALGPLTIGQFPFYAGLWAARQGAERVVRDLRRRAT